MVRKLGAAVLLPFFAGGGELGPYLTQCRMGQGLPPYTKWHLNRFSRLATMDMVQKLGAVPPFCGGESWVPI